MQIIDLSLPIDDTLKETHAAKIERISHKQGVEHFNWVLMTKQPNGEERFKKGERLVKPEDIPDKELLSLEIVHSSVHMGTHVDAPFHYGSKSQGAPSKYIDDLPLEWCYSDGVVLDFSHKKYPEIINKKDIIDALKKINPAPRSIHTRLKPNSCTQELYQGRGITRSGINYKLKPLDIVLLRTDSDKMVGSDNYVNKYVGVQPEAIEYLLDKGIKMIGIDTLGMDRPCFDMFREFLETKDKSKLWPSHFLGRKREYAHMERLANLAKIPKPFGFKVSCLPVRIRNTGASWSRVVAIID